MRSLSTQAAYGDDGKMTLLFLPVQFWKTLYQICDLPVKVTSKQDTVFSYPFGHIANTITVPLI